MSSFRSRGALLPPSSHSLRKDVKKVKLLAVSRNENQRTGECVFSSSDLPNEEPVQLVLTAVDTGLNLVNVDFKTGLDGDESIISGFLTALKHMSDMMFPQPFDRMVFGQYTMIMRIESPFLFCYVFQGNTSQATRRLCNFIRVLRGKDSLLDSLKSTITCGAVDNSAKTSIRTIATQVFTYPDQSLRSVG